MSKISWMQIIIGASVGLIPSVIIAYVIPHLSTYNPTLFSVSYLIIASIIFITLVLIMKIIYKLPWLPILVLITAFLLAMAIFSMFFYSSDLVTVPDLTGKSQDDVVTTLEKTGLTPKINYKEVDREDQVDKVISQDPLPGLNVKKNTVVNIVIGKKEELKLNITEPIEWTLVEQNTILKGTISGKNAAQNIYVLIQPQPFQKETQYWWVQPQVIINNDGNWSSAVQIGEVQDNGKGRKFKIAVIVTRENLTSGKYGLDLPGNIDIMKIITVIRK